MSIHAKVPPPPEPPPDAVAVSYDERYFLSLLRGMAHNRGQRVAWAGPMLEYVNALRASAGELAEAQAEAQRFAAKAQRLIERAVEREAMLAKVRATNTERAARHADELAKLRAASAERATAHADAMAKLRVAYTHLRARDRRRTAIDKKAAKAAKAAKKETPCTK